MITGKKLSDKTGGAMTVYKRPECNFYWNLSDICYYAFPTVDVNE